jgi:hypothetical protein
VAISARERTPCGTRSLLRAGGPLTGHVAVRTLLGKCSSAVARTGAAMKPTQIGNRVVVIGPTAPAAEKITNRGTTDQRPTTRRIVVIKDGQMVGSRPGR